MEFFLNPSNWAGLLTLIMLEVILGIDNLVFVAILSEKLPSFQQDNARLIGLSLALFMRLGLLSLISWIATLTNPIINNNYFHLSGHNLILLLGGIFLLFKATTELHERLENKDNLNISNKNYASFWVVITQIVILDTVFSLDSIVTAVGIVNKLSIMMIAVIIAMVLMLLASKILTNFIRSHPTVVVLCLSFLLLIGFSLVMESIGFLIPKEYLYVAISFSILIELFNQTACRNFMQYQSKLPMRQRTAEAIFRLVTREKNTFLKNNILSKKNNLITLPTLENEVFKDEEKYMINGVLTLSGRSIRSIMTPRGKISWVDIEQKKEDIRKQLLTSPHSLFPVCKGEIDEIIGIVRAKELLVALEKNIDVITFASKISPIIIPETLNSINLISILRKSKGNFVIVTNEFGAVQGLITPLDVLEAIVGEFPDADETPDVISENGSWLVKGSTDLHSLSQLFNTTNLIKNKDSYASLAGLLIAQKGQLPHPGEKIIIDSLTFYIIEASEYRIDLIRITINKAITHNSKN
ncbi:TerC family protein [Buchnera aphidicola (Nipponaphis monzeni)]|uniref:TerC family protein n=1 Tax=Buchnera aphidicola (Nipponaphis monzeni) TaxID=2495405 RepID=A0A455TAA7_9GAMM|nr:TerC family protein [Buchnera aphidicola]BBI01263.1 TerC family protein [Buchnera aphidicola (Nipponaphis monzeni)]